jgi:diketogulonate reductase-like aldo/keto reductase
LSNPYIFCHADIPTDYQNEDSVGVAIKESGLARSEVYVTTKYTQGDIRDSVKSSLSKVFLA